MQKTNGSAVDPFARFALPLELREGVEVELTGTPAVFMVAPMSQHNELFQNELMGRLPISINIAEELDEDAIAAEVKPMEFMRMQRESFVSACILSHRGLPDDMDRDAFFKAYPFALSLLFSRAREITQEFDKRMADLMGNSSGSSTGRSDGTEESRNTKQSRRRASSPKKPGGRTQAH